MVTIKAFDVLIEVILRIYTILLVILSRLSFLQKTLYYPRRF